MRDGCGEVAGELFVWTGIATPGGSWSLRRLQALGHTPAPLQAVMNTLKKDK